MINISNFLSNTKIDIYRPDVLVDEKGGIDKFLSLIYKDIPVKIEQYNVENRLEISGKKYQSLYLIHIWLNAYNTDLVRDNDLLKDKNTKKTYKVLKIKAGSLFKTKPYKYEVIATVIKDERFKDFKKNL